MSNRYRAALAAAVVLVASIAATHAAFEQRAPSRFDGRVVHREGGAGPVLPRPVESLADSDGLCSR